MPHEFNIFLGFSILTCTPAVLTAVPHAMGVSVSQGQPMGQIWPVVWFCTACELRMAFYISKDLFKDIHRHIFIE